MSTTIGHFVLSEPETDTAATCPTCHFDALVSFPIHLISERGVSDFGHCTACIRCYEEAGA